MEQTKYDVFISYLRKDYVDEHKNVIPDNEVSKIKEALTDAGVLYWIDEKGVIPGEDYAAKITKYIKACKIFLYISSKAANESDWTRKEIATALIYNKYIIPLLLDNSPFHDSVILRIADLDRIDYYVNPQLGLDKLVRSIKTFLEETKRKQQEGTIVLRILEECELLLNEEKNLELERSNLLLQIEQLSDKSKKESLKEKLNKNDSKHRHTALLGENIKLKQSVNKLEASIKQKRQADCCNGNSTIHIF